jgi:hypothetical protein
MLALEKFEQQSQKIKLPIDGKMQEVHDPYYARELSFLDGRTGVSRQDLPKPGGSSEFEVVGIPLAKPGYHIVEIESQLLGTALLATPKPMYVRAAALVTNLAVHLKTGKDNALVWVTTLDSGQHFRLRWQVDVARQNRQPWSRHGRQGITHAKL